MSSWVTDILASAGSLEKQDLGAKICVLTGQIDDLKKQLQESLMKCYIDFVPMSLNTNNLENKATIYTNEIQSLSNIIQNELIVEIQDSAEEFKEIHVQLRVAESTLQVVNSLIAIHDASLQCTANFKRQNFLEAVRSLQEMREIQTFLKSTWTGGQIKLLESLEREYLVHAERLKYDMEEMWKEYITWTVEESVQGDAKGSTSVQLTVTTSREKLESLVKAMYRMKNLENLLKRFVNRLNEYVVRPVICRASWVKVDAEVNALNVKQASAFEQIPSPGEVFDKLITIFAFLNRVFGPIRVLEDEDDKLNLLQHLGTMMYTDFCNFLIRECLSKAIPSRRKDLEVYNSVIVATTKFHEKLLEMGIASADDDSILKYAENVDALFANKMCQELLCKSRRVMMEDLYNVVSAPSSTLGCKSKDATNVKAEHRSQNESAVSIKQEFGEVPDENQSNSKLLDFPECQISISTQKLVDMLYDIMEEASRSSQQCASRLFVTARNIVHLYCDIMPCYHKDSLESLPQQSALFHNNCMYLAHHLMTLGHQFRSRLPSPLDESIVTFLDLVPKVRKLGVEVFLEQMRIQRKRLLGILAEAGDFRNIIGEAKFVSVVERALKQCMLQLEHLKKVWHGVLPQNVCRKSLGTLLNTLLEEIIMKVTTLEDLPADNAAHLIDVLEVVKDRAPGFFKSPDPASAVIDLQRYVPKWLKFQELLKVLAANMQDILDRWASGKGPLAQEFTVDEAKQLIRALFQNTDRRAAVLAKIK